MGQIDPAPAKTLPPALWQAAHTTDHTAEAAAVAAYPPRATTRAAATDDALAIEAAVDAASTAAGYAVEIAAAHTAKHAAYENIYDARPISQEIVDGPDEDDGWGVAYATVEAAEAAAGLADETAQLPGSSAEQAADPANVAPAWATLEQELKTATWKARPVFFEGVQGVAIPSARLSGVA